MLLVWVLGLSILHMFTIFQVKYFKNFLVEPLWKRDFGDDGLSPC